MSDKKILVLFNGRWSIDRYFIDYVDVVGVDIDSMYKVNGRNIKYLMAVMWMEKLKLPCQSIWYGSWKKKINHYDVVIIFACGLNLSWRMICYIKKNNKNIRLIVWYWDKVDKSNIEYKYRHLYEKWSFDENDCEKYGMKKNTQFYYPLYINKCENIQYDAMFVGRDKGRVQKLKDIESGLKNAGLKVYTYIQRDKRENGQKRKKPIEYRDIVRLIGQSKCIIDIPKQGQSGLTIRSLEALFYNKKLITIDRTIKYRDFYNPNNILIWNNQSANEIRDFMNKPYVYIDDEIIKRYTFEQWIENFG